MAAPSRQKVLRLYKQLLRETNKFCHYSYREYTIRRIKTGFRENLHESDSEKITQLIQQGDAALGVITRQVIVNEMFQGKKLIVEKPLLEISQA